MVTKRNKILLVGIVLLSLSFVLGALMYVYMQPETDFDYGIMIDMGSSHSRLQIFMWPHRFDRTLPLVENAPIGQHEWTFTMKPGIATLSLNEIPSYLCHMTDYAQFKIPNFMHSHTPIFLLATAGMRALPLEKQTVILGIVRDFVISSTPFEFKDDYAKVITGEMEGLFGWLSVNYLSEDLSEDIHSVGALDLGGASTQITFEPAERPVLHEYNLTLGLENYDIYTHSFLGFGVNMFMEKYYQDLSKIHYSDIPSPCFLIGYNKTIDDVNYYGTSDPDSCHQVVLSLLGLTDPCEHIPCSLVGIYQPPLISKFVAFSNFFSVSSFFKIIGETPLIVFKQNVDKFCLLDWNNATSIYSDPYLSTSCLLGVYVYELLTSGYHFSPIPNESVISFENAIKDVELGWSLGAMIYEANLLPWGGNDGIHNAPIGTTTGIALIILAGLLLLLGLFTIYIGTCVKRQYLLDTEKPLLVLDP